MGAGEETHTDCLTLAHTQTKVQVASPRGRLHKKSQTSGEKRVQLHIVYHKQPLEVQVTQRQGGIFRPAHTFHPSHQVKNIPSCLDVGLRKVYDLSVLVPAWMLKQ